MCKEAGGGLDSTHSCLLYLKSTEVPEAATNTTAAHRQISLTARMQGTADRHCQLGCLVNTMPMPRQPESSHPSAATHAHVF